MSKAKKNGSETYKLLERGERKLPVELDPAERDARAHTLAKLVQNFRALDAKRAEVAREWRVKLKAAKEEIDEAAIAVEEGVEQKKFVVEVRAVFATRSVDTVRVEDGEVLESRAMTTDESRDYLQPPLDIGAPAETPDVIDVPLGLPYRPDDGEIIDAETEPDDGDADADDAAAVRDEGEYEALGLPANWPPRWRGKTWKVGDAELAESDVLEVYLRVSGAGVELEELAGKLTWLNRAQVGRALALLKKQGMVEKVGGKFCAVEGEPEEPEPGRADPLPEASAAPKPRRRRAKDTGEQAINAALGQSEAMEAGA